MVGLAKLRQGGLKQAGEGGGAGAMPSREPMAARAPLILEQSTGGGVSAFTPDEALLEMRDLGDVRAMCGIGGAGLEFGYGEVQPTNQVANRGRCAQETARSQY
jgi:hypothetical protein